MTDPLADIKERFDRAWQEIHDHVSAPEPSWINWSRLLVELEECHRALVERLGRAEEAREIAVNWILAVRRAARAAPISQDALIEGATKILDEQRAALASPDERKPDE